MKKYSLYAWMLCLPACLGGEGKAVVDAAVTPDSEQLIDAAEPQETACALAMKDAPTGTLPYTDALATATLNTWDKLTIPEAGDPNYPGGKYRTLTADGADNIHPGCSIEGLAYTPAQIEGYPCAAQEFAFPDGVVEDTTKPIVILVHGNSDSPESWRAYVHPNPDSIVDFTADTSPRSQLAEKLPELGYRTIAVDMRIDLNDDSTDQTSGNPAQNIDHGWGVPITQALIKQIAINHPDRKIAVLGFSLGATIARDALRRLWAEWKDGQWDTNIMAQLTDVILASGGHHGVSTFPYCNSNTTMKGLVTCEFGQRNQYTQTDFHKPLNGPAVPTELTRDGEFGGWYETPCADGDYAFGTRDACGGNTVQYTSITMSDLPDGTQQDLFVSEHASRMYPEACVDNHVNGLNDFDTSAYFYNGLFRNHYGSVRSEAGLAKIISVLGD